MRTIALPTRSTTPAKPLPEPIQSLRNVRYAPGRQERVQYGYTPVKSRARMESVDQGSRLERLRRSRPLGESLGERSRDVAPLEYLKILHNRKTQEYRIGDRAGKVFIDQEFSTLEYCRDAAVELEQVFDIALVLGQRDGETLERIEAIVEWFWLREWVALGLGEKE